MTITREEILARQKEDERQADKRLAAQLLKDIPYFHKRYAKYKNPNSLEAARLAGIVLDKLYKKWGVDKPLGI